MRKMLRSSVSVSRYTTDRFSYVLVRCPLFQRHWKKIKIPSFCACVKVSIFDSIIFENEREQINERKNNNSWCDIDDWCGLC